MNGKEVSEKIRIFEGETYSAAITTTNQLVIWNNETRVTTYFKASDVDYGVDDKTKMSKDETLSKALVSTAPSSALTPSLALTPAPSLALALYSPPSYMATPDPTPDPYSLAGALALVPYEKDAISKNFKDLLISNPPNEYKEIGIYEDSNERKTFYYLLALSKSNELYRFEIIEKPVLETTPSKISLKNGVHLQVKRTFKKLLVSKDRALALDSNGRIYPITKNIQKISQSYTNISFKDLTMTDNHFVGVSENDTLITWGYCNEGNISFSGELLKNNVKRIFSGDNVSVILYKSGAIEVKGNNKAEQISDANTVMGTDYIFDPISKTPSAGPLALGRNPIVNVAVTENLCFALLSDGSKNLIKVWGKDRSIYENRIPKIVRESKILALYPGRKSIYCLIERKFNGEPSYSFVTWGVSINKKKFVTDRDYSSSDVYIPDLFFSKNFSKEFEINFKNHGFSSNSLEELLSRDADDSTFRFIGKFEYSVTATGIAVPKSFITNIIDNEKFNITPVENTKDKIYTLNDTIDGKSYILKKVSYEPETLKILNFHNSLRDEALNQIILYSQRNIDICGKLKYVLLDETESNVGYIIQEKFDMTLFGYMYFNSVNLLTTVPLPADSTKYILDTQFFTYIKTLVKKIKALESKGLEFNHRDLKIDNIMIKETTNPDDIYLIDFGISCIDLNRYKTGFDTSKFSKTKCYKESRDFSWFFISCLILYDKYNRVDAIGGQVKIFTDFTLELIKEVLKVNLKNEVSKCLIYGKCINENNIDYIKLLNKSYVFNEKTSFENIDKTLDDIITNLTNKIANTP